MTQPRRAARIVSCTGKDALSATAAKRLARKIREKGDRVVPYLCTHCRAWHVGTSLVHERRRRPRAPIDDGGLDG